MRREICLSSDTIGTCAAPPLLQLYKQYGVKGNRKDESLDNINDDETGSDI